MSQAFETDSRLTLPCLRLRQSSHVVSLVAAYDLVKYMRIIPPVPATAQQLCEYHSDDYIDFLLTAETLDSTTESFTELAEEFGLQYDCPVFPGMANYVTHVAGGSLSAARALADGDCDVAIHWDGGRDEASGFCYVNDIVLAIGQLQETFPRIMYIDIDVHHGDGVEKAFAFSPRVLTVSFHRQELGFFPGETLVGS
ncbi:hypothetical protein BDK51DRAFT_47419 [Blyttiomyces helicus]|uniref:Histone deacetylase 8 n=1 Tax=Blyttiomyces helicus TaxID=388810 RepID=A0A4P9W747_9FUNG|nr:hypothetical protein BDK51DRAFT_47419 [Blyttiomyces helicus]|eukprot:RKO85966.1 hypothetical protein BDK51DRAFT_47419 [Blyttiomyces helicus]